MFFIKGIQNPVRGLFIRNFLLQKIKDILPDTGNEYTNSEDTVIYSSHYILQNLSEMNKLWSQMIPSAKARDIEKKYADRNDVKVLIGSNLDRLSHLDGLTVDLYINDVFPSLIRIILNCKDSQSQEYLINCIIDV